MKCRRCGKELGSASRCNFCGYQNADDSGVREMSAVERNNYDGLTIEVRSNEDHHHYHQYQRAHSGFQHSARINSNPTGFWTQTFGNHILTRIIVALVLVLLIAFTLFVALPIALTVIGCLVVYYFVRRMVFRR